MATHSSILAWGMPWTEEPGGRQSVESHRVGHDPSDLARTHTVTSDVAHLFLYLLAICISALDKDCSSPLPIF